MRNGNPEGLTVEQAISRLTVLIEEAYPKLRALSEVEASVSPAGMRWRRKEILGHLIDSASNNHQRFVRAQFQATMSFPRYAQEQWVDAQGYAERPWLEILELWRLYNRHLVHVMGRVPPSAFANVCTVADDEPSTLGDHMIDYGVHLERHLRQILG